MLTVKQLEKSFGDTKILKGIDFSMEKGDRVVIIGPSGSGKSTFLRCLNMLEKPTKGTITFEKVELNQHNLANLRQKIGMVFQSFNLFSNLTVENNLILAPVKTKKMTEEEAKKKAKALLKRINLEDKADVYPDSLSGGQKQRVAIIRSLMMEPDIMLFDEPTSALDPEMIEEVLTLMKEVAHEGMSMIIVTHELEFAREIATKVIFMDQGKIMEESPPEELFEHPKTERLREFLSKIK